VQWGFCHASDIVLSGTRTKKRPARRGLIGIVETPFDAAPHAARSPIVASRECSFRYRRSPHLSRRYRRSLFFKVRSSYAKVRNSGGGYWRKRRESRVRGRLRCRARFAACWAFAQATVCYLKVTKRGYACGPSGLRAHSRNLKELGTPELIPAGRELFVGFGSFVDDDDSRRH
jgi:hypothetical protein